MKLPKRKTRNTSPSSFTASVGCLTQNLTRYTVRPLIAGTESEGTMITMCTRRFFNHRYGKLLRNFNTPK